MSVLLNLQPLHSARQVPVLDELRQCCGDILIITEFIYTYGTFIGQENKINLTPGKNIHIEAIS